MDRRGEVIDYTLEQIWQGQCRPDHHLWHDESQNGDQRCGTRFECSSCKGQRNCQTCSGRSQYHLGQSLGKRSRSQANCMKRMKKHSAIIDIGKKLEGSIRNTGIHAAGMIISGDPFTDFIPICIAKDSEMAVTQYSMKPVELVGMLKIDFLGSQNTDLPFKSACDAIKQNTGHEIDWVNLPLDDQPSFRSAQSRKNTRDVPAGIWRDARSGRQLHLDKFEEIIAVGALYRPGPMDMIPSFINRKHGREPIEFDHPWMEDDSCRDLWDHGLSRTGDADRQQACAIFAWRRGCACAARWGKKTMEQMATAARKISTRGA